MCDAITTPLGLAEATRQLRREQQRSAWGSAEQAHVGARDEQIKRLMASVGCEVVTDGDNWACARKDFAMRMYEMDEDTMVTQDEARTECEKHGADFADYLRDCREDMDENGEVPALSVLRWLGY